MSNVFFNQSESVVIVTRKGFSFVRRDWDNKIIDAVKRNPKCIIMPAYRSVAGSFKKVAYGGFLDITEVRGGVPIILEPRWNLEVPEGGIIDCVMGGVYACHSDWYRDICDCLGMKEGGAMDLVAISLKTRLAGGSCVVLQDVVAEQSFDGLPIVDPETVAYNKIRLAMTTLPCGISTIVPTLLAGTQGLEKAMKDIMDDIKEIHNDRECFEAICGCSLAEAAARAGITFGLFQKQAEF
jgi:hypothetical protein